MDFSQRIDYSETPLRIKDKGVFFMGGLVKRGVIFIAATALAASILFFFFHERTEPLPGTSGRETIPQYQDAARPIHAPVGSEFAIVLESSGNSGGRWHLEDAGEPSLLEIVEIKRNALRGKKDGMKLRDLWIFRALREGETRAAFQMSGLIKDPTQRAEEKKFQIIIEGLSTP